MTTSSLTLEALSAAWGICAPQLIRRLSAVVVVFSLLLSGCELVLLGAVVPGVVTSLPNIHCWDLYGDPFYSVYNEDNVIDEDTINDEDMLIE